MLDSVGGPFGILVEYVCTLSHYNPIRIWLYIQVESDEIENYMCSCSQSVDKFKTWIGLSTQTMYFLLQFHVNVITKCTIHQCTILSEEYGIMKTFREQ